MATRSEEVLIRVGLDNSAVARGANELRGTMQTVGKSIAAAFSGAAILGGMNKVLNYFDDLQDKAENLDVGTNFLQGMGQVARENAVGGLKTFDKAIGELSAKLGSAKSGSKEAIATFQKYGITLAEIQTLNTEQMFYRIADAVKAIPDPARRTAAAFELLGKSGKNMTGILAGGAESLENSVNAVNKLDPDKVKQLAAAKDTIEGATNNLTIWGGKAMGYIGAYYAFWGRLSTGMDTMRKASHEEELQRIEREKRARESATNEVIELERAAAEERSAAFAESARQSWETGDRILDLINRRNAINRSIPTIDELARSSGPLQQSAQVYQRAEAYQREMRIAGNIAEAERARGWMNWEQSLIGFYTGGRNPNAEIANIDRQIADLNATLSNGTVNVNVVGTE